MSQSRQSLFFVQAIYFLFSCVRAYAIRIRGREKKKSRREKTTRKSLHRPSSSWSLIARRVQPTDQRLLDRPNRR